MQIHPRNNIAAAVFLASPVTMKHRSDADKSKKVGWTAVLIYRNFLIA